MYQEEFLLQLVLRVNFFCMLTDAAVILTKKTTRRRTVIFHMLLSITPTLQETAENKNTSKCPTFKIGKAGSKLDVCIFLCVGSSKAMKSSLQ